MSKDSIEFGSRFIASTLHEIRTPIQTVISTIELLEDTNLDKEQIEYVHQIDFSANTLLQLANDILDFTKIQSDQFKLESIPYDIIELTEQVVDLISIEAFNRGIQVITDIDYSLPPEVMGDPNRVQQIILNLVKNAVKFTEKGFILVRVTKWRNNLLFEIADSGIGISDDKKELIFKDFYQIDSSTTKKYSGTGLGLSICKNLVNVMKGKIGVLSNPSGGSNFWFSIPLEASSLSQQKNQEVKISKTTNILILEKNHLAQNTLIRKLKYFGVKKIFCTDSVEKAINKISTNFTVALVDSSYTTGEIEKLSKCLNENNNNATKIYLMIPEGQMDKEIRAMTSNVYSGYIYKPIKRRQLSEILDSRKQNDNEKLITSLNTDREFKYKYADILPGKNNKILVAEDHPVNRKLIKTILEKFGAQVYVAEDGEEAIQIIKANPNIEIIFMDIFMPNKNGLDAAFELRHMHYKGIIIACTANNNPEDFKEYTRLGINDVLLKPFRKDAVSQLLEKWNCVLMIPEAMDIISLVDINNQAEDSDLWNISSFMEITNSNKELSISLMTDFIEQTKTKLEKLKNELAKKELNISEIQMITHSLKGSCAAISSKKLYDFACQMNDAIKENDLVQFKTARTNFALDFFELENIVSKWKISL